MILDGERRLRILDFGLARMEGQESLSVSGDLVGTPQYMSPEQARSKKVTVDHRTDIYSLGATMYEMLTLHPPFRGKDHADTLSQIIERDPILPRKINPRVPPELETIVLKCLRKESADRYGTAEALAQDLRRFVRRDAIEARAQSRWEVLVRRAQRHWGKLASGAVAMVLILVCARLGYRVYQEQQRIQARDYERSIASAAMKILRGELLLTAGPVDGDTSDFFLSTEYRDLLSQTTAETLEGSLIDLKTNLERFPRRVEARYFRAKGLWLLNRRSEALLEVDGALRVDPGFAPALALRGTILGNLDVQLEEIIRANEGSPSGASLWGPTWARAYSAARHYDWEKAAVAYTDLIANDASGEAYAGAAVEHLLRRGIAHLFCRRAVAAALDFQAAHTRAQVDWGEFLEPMILLGKALYLVPSEELADVVLAQTLNGISGPAQEEHSLWVSAIYAQLVNDTSCRNFSCTDEQLP